MILSEKSQICAPIVAHGNVLLLEPINQMRQKASLSYLCTVRNMTSIGCRLATLSFYWRCNPAIKLYLPRLWAAICFANVSLFQKLCDGYGNILQGTCFIINLADFQGKTFSKLDFLANQQEEVEDFFGSWFFLDSGQFSLEEVLMIKVSIKVHGKFCLLQQLSDGWEESFNQTWKNLSMKSN